MIPISFVPPSGKLIKSDLLLIVPHMLLIYSSVIYKEFCLESLYSACDPATAKVNGVIHSEGNGLELCSCFLLYFC